MSTNDNPYRSPAHTTPAKRPRKFRTPTFVANAGWAWATIIALAVVGLCAGASVTHNLALLSFADLADAGGATEAAGEVIDQRGVVIGIAMVVMFVVTAVMWSVWSLRAYRNLSALGRRNPESASAHAVYGWYFVPFANLVKPYTKMTEMWRKSIPSETTPGRRPKVGVVPVYVPFWWGGWLLMNVASRIDTSFTKAIHDVPSMRLAGQVGLVSDAVAIIAVVFAVLVVRGLQGRQESAYAQQMNAPQANAAEPTEAPELIPG